MSRTWSLEFIEQHMRAQISEYLQDWLKHSAAIDKQLVAAGFDISGVKPVHQLAIQILKERGDYSA